MDIINAGDLFMYLFLDKDIFSGKKFVAVIQIDLCKYVFHKYFVDCFMYL